MSKKKVRAGHRRFLTGVLPDVGECLNNYEAEKKVELAKCHTVLKEQLDKILPLDEEIYAELIADEKSTEEDITAEIDRAARLKADVLQRLAAIDEKLTVLQPGLSESQNMSSPLNQNVVEKGATSSSANSKTVRVKLPKLEVRKFSGKLEEWQEFWDSFESAIMIQTTAFQKWINFHNSESCC